VLLRPLAAVAAVLVLAGCATTTAAAPAVQTSAEAATCKGPAVPVVVSVDQWGDITSALGGECAQVTTILASSSVDPHTYEPTTGDLAEFSGARLVVINGAGYDTWASKAVATLSPTPAVVDGGAVVGVASGANPHLWYNPSYVYRIAAAITAALTAAQPGAAPYFEQQAAAWRTSMKAYDEQIAAIRAAAAGRTYGATEGVFDYMAAAVGLRNLTPRGWQNAAANDSDPAPGDVLGFDNALNSKEMSVLIYNTQTEGPLPAQVAATAVSAGVPVVEVTETVAAGSTSFLQWQLSQLKSLAAALGVHGS
jgi:zinc/manganese transport system substrate-binding protein